MTKDRIRLGECACGPRPKAVWETDNHEPEGEVPIGGQEDAANRIRCTPDKPHDFEVSKNGGPYEPYVHGQEATGTDDGGDVSCAIPGVHTTVQVKPGEGGGAGPPPGFPKVNPGIGGADPFPPSPQVDPGAGGAIHMDPSKVSKDDGTTLVGEVTLFDAMPKGFAHLGELAAQLGVDPLKKDGRAHWVMSCEEGLEYDVWGVLVALLAKLRSFPKLPDVVRQLDHATEEAIRRQGQLDSANEQVEQLRVQLAGCLMAAEGAVDEAQLAHPGDFGWSKAYQATIDLQKAHQEALDELLAIRDELERAGVDLSRGEMAVDGVKAVLQILELRSREAKRSESDQAFVKEAVKVATELRERETRQMMLDGAEVVLAALGSQSGGARTAAERLVRKNDDWFVMAELLRLERDGICPSCLGKADSRRMDEGGTCCWIDCHGNYAAGCYHCHGATNMPLDLARELLLKREEKTTGVGGDGMIIAGSGKSGGDDGDE